MTSSDAVVLNTTISFEKFDGILARVKQIHELENALTDLSIKYQNDSRDEFHMLLPSALETELVDLLSRMFNDLDTDWIGYWIYELDFGNKYYDGVIVDKEGKSITLKSSRNLWNLLLKECVRQDA